MSDQRKAFESWIKLHSEDGDFETHRHKDGWYTNHITNLKWDGWRSAMNHIAQAEMMAVGYIARCDRLHAENEAQANLINELKSSLKECLELGESLINEDNTVSHEEFIADFEEVSRGYKLLEPGIDEKLIEEKAELTKNAQRYEIVRKFNLRQFTDIYVENLSGGARFDDLVDNFKP